ncbi:Calcium-transporting ATPase 10, plasma membrane-type [Camellia lanceoleosa]|uniref:Calcium-transporting ATPase 10, plasma membrane-type n=1 Tax=Camellia lanceoleosa TaxID=1840588 RepID=A0ACC0GMN0_9ERIC|nr:Calcium-transporting ATPase 10, plasma membrane-type [Camellia lanceoleosa]
MLLFFFELLLLFFFESYWCFNVKGSLNKIRDAKQAALVLNASRRFRYTLDLKKEEKKERIRKIRAHAQVIRICSTRRLPSARLLAILLKISSIILAAELKSQQMSSIFRTSKQV